MAGAAVWAAFALATGLYGAAAALTVLAGAGDAGTVTGILLYAFPVVGALIAIRRPENLIGWLCLGFGLSSGALGAIEAYVAYATQASGGSPTGLGLALAYANAGWIPPIGMMIFLVLLFPDGRLPSPRWRIVSWLTALTLLFLAIANLLGPADFAESGFPDVANPIHLRPIAPLLSQLQPLELFLPASILAAALSIAARYRRASGVVRLQLKWLAAAGVAVAFFFVTAIAMTALVPGGDSADSLAAVIAQNLAAASFALIPIAIGFATLRYRLYDIDVIVNRTLVYGGATVILAAAFGVVNLVAQRALDTLTGWRSDVITAALAVAAALAFGPMRRWMRPVVDGFLPARAELALLFTDVVGSTRVAAEIGDERWRSLLDRYRGAVRRELRRFGGREIDTAGDGFFATFDRPAAAVACAWRMRWAVHALGLDTRAGLHLGECQMRGDTPTGLAVHVAARIMGAAPDGAVVVSEAVRQAIADLDVELTEHGVHELKGVPGDWPLYRVEALPTTG